MRTVIPILTLCMLLGGTELRSQFPGTRILDTLGYSGCIELYNASTHVVLDPNCGGRVLVYSLQGKNILYTHQREEGCVSNRADGEDFIDAGRFDFGPEFTTKPHPVLFAGKWNGIVCGPREAVLVSQPDTGTGVRLSRRFILSSHSSHLVCTQSIKNISDGILEYYHWSRTFVKGGGITIVPFNPGSRYPKAYLSYQTNQSIKYMPDDSGVQVHKGTIQIPGTPSYAKLVFDLAEGWMGYVSRDGQLFLKTFKIFPGRVYGDLAGNNASLWICKDQICEIEPIGPLEFIPPGDSASFTEQWWLHKFKHPLNKLVDPADIYRFLE